MGYSEIYLTLLTSRHSLEFLFMQSENIPDDRNGGKPTEHQHIKIDVI